MISISRSRWAGIDSWAGQGLYSLAPAVEEGMALCGIMETGLLKSTVLANPGNTDVFMGLAYNYYTSPTQLVAVETFTVPSAPGPYTVLLTNTPIAGTTDLLAKDATNQVYAFNAAHGANQYALTAGNLITFDSSAAGAVVTFTYLYSPTAQQIAALFGDGVAGHTTAAAVTGTIGLIRRGLVYITNFDPVVDWSTNPAMKVIANGLVGTTGSGPTIPGYVYEVPSADSPYLGINFSAV